MGVVVRRHTGGPAGPRWLLLKAFDRLGAPAAAYPFYVEHAEADPRHGKNWLELAIAPVLTETPQWGPRIIKGAWWRCTVNLAFFERLRQDHCGADERRRTSAVCVRLRLAPRSRGGHSAVRKQALRQ